MSGISGSAYGAVYGPSGYGIGGCIRSPDHLHRICGFFGIRDHMRSAVGSWNGKTVPAHIAVPLPAVPASGGIPAKPHSGGIRRLVRLSGGRVSDGGHIRYPVSESSPV